MEFRCRVDVGGIGKWCLGKVGTEGDAVEFRCRGDNGGEAVGFGWREAMYVP